MNESDENKTVGGKDATEPTWTLEPVREKREPRRGQRGLIFAGIVAIAFLLGFVPMWIKALNHGRERDAVQRELHVAQLQLSLASAAIDARLGEYEPARRSAAKFFTDLTGEMERGKDSALSSAQRDALKPLLQQRDDLITFLARNDPASAERLAQMHVLWRKTVSEGAAVSKTD